VSATLSSAGGGPNGGKTPPDDDEVRECSHPECGAWRYSWLAIQFHQLREHVLDDSEGNR
jgi:hypothetical protein